MIKFIETQVIPKSLILSPLFCFSKKRLFEEIADCAGYVLQKPAKEIIDALNRRETYGTTVFYPVSKYDDSAKIESLLKNITIVLSNNDLLNSLRLVKNEPSKLAILLNKIDYILDKPVQEPAQAN